MKWKKGLTKVSYFFPVSLWITTVMPNIGAGNKVQPRNLMTRKLLITNLQTAMHTTQLVASAFVYGS